MQGLCLPATSCPHLGGCIVRAARCRQTIRELASLRATKEFELPRSSWQTLDLKHVVEAQQFGTDALDVIFQTAREIEEKERDPSLADVLKGKVVSTLFYEPSTRTRLSFESAIVRLGGTVLSTESAGEYSSAAKGETLEGKSHTYISHFSMQVKPIAFTWDLAVLYIASASPTRPLAVHYYLFLFPSFIFKCFACLQTPFVRCNVTQMP
jgi:Aspartate/ornithine carbamoyltransferase, carbamoyl-P binding domain